jgi:hypothetical protein
MKRRRQLRPWLSCSAVVMDDGLQRVLDAFFELVVASCFQNAQSRLLAGADAWHTLSVRLYARTPCPLPPWPSRGEFRRRRRGLSTSALLVAAGSRSPVVLLCSRIPQMQAPSWKKIVVNACQKGL